MLKLENPNDRLKVASNADLLILKLDNYDDLLRQFEFPTSPAHLITEDDVRNRWDELYEEIKGFKSWFDSIKHLLEPNDECDVNYSASGTPIRRSIRLMEKKRET